LIFSHIKKKKWFKHKICNQTMCDDNISFSIDDTNINNSELVDVSNLLGDSDTEDLRVTQILNYQLNMNVKQLLQICDYYGISKGLKSNKRTKEEIINLLVDFEDNDTNYEIVCKRRLMWFYIEELRSDKFMKKHIFW
jgi:hypothetical protein